MDLISPVGTCLFKIPKNSNFNSVRSKAFMLTDSFRHFMFVLRQWASNATATTSEGASTQSCSSAVRSDIVATAATLGRLRCLQVRRYRARRRRTNTKLTRLGSTAQLLTTSTYDHARLGTAVLCGHCIAVYSPTCAVRRVGTSTATVVISS